jgi:hypothetical protein
MARSKTDSQDANLEHWWFNLKTGQAEFGRKSNSLDRVGPFDSEADARKALELIANRSAEWQRSEQAED